MAFGDRYCSSCGMPVGDQGSYKTFSILNADTATTALTDGQHELMARLEAVAQRGPVTDLDVEEALALEAKLADPPWFLEAYLYASRTSAQHERHIMLHEGETQGGVVARLFERFTKELIPDYFSTVLPYDEHQFASQAMFEGLRTWLARKVLTRLLLHLWRQGIKEAPPGADVARLMEVYGTEFVRQASKDAQELYAKA